VPGDAPIGSAWMVSMMRLLPLPAVAVQRRVVVTGLGAVSPLACGMEETWARLLRGASGVRQLQADDPHYPVSGILQFNAR
jgi:Beta-ketoacyl synthase, N-terminal domain